MHTVYQYKYATMPMSYGAYSLYPSQELNRDAFIASCDVCPTCSEAPDALVIDGTDTWIKRNKLPEGFERCVPLCEYLLGL